MVWGSFSLYLPHLKFAIEKEITDQSRILQGLGVDMVSDVERLIEEAYEQPSVRKGLEWTMVPGAEGG